MIIIFHYYTQSQLEDSMYESPYSGLVGLYQKVVQRTTSSVSDTLLGMLDLTSKVPGMFFMPFISHPRVICPSTFKYVTGIIKPSDTSGSFS